MAFLTTSTITLSCLDSAPLQAESWWHVVADVVFADVAGHALPILFHGPGSAHKNGMVKTFTHTSIPIHPCTLLKNEKEKERAKRSTDQTWFLRLLVLFLSTVVLGDGQEARHLLLRTAPRRTPSRLGQQWQKTFVDIFNKYCNIARKTIRFLTTSTITFNCLASAAPQADSWRLGHVEPDGVVIADIAGQALDICLHGPESARKNGMVKTFTHTSIPIHPCTLLKQRAKPSTHQTWRLRSVILFCPVWRWATIGKLGRCPSEMHHVGGLLT